jgi:hypothetical protein
MKNIGVLIVIAIMILGSIAVSVQTQSILKGIGTFVCLIVVIGLLAFAKTQAKKENLEP